MNIFQFVKSQITTRQAAEHYGLNVQRNGMTLCPFHDDHVPSLKVDTRFYCFGCQADGDVIDFTARLFGLTPKDAAEKLAAAKAESAVLTETNKQLIAAIESKTAPNKTAASLMRLLFYDSSWLGSNFNATPLIQ